ncbi:MAG: T9SS type A sorting domain-containing protein, partial [Chitinophagales bacterium]
IQQSLNNCATGDTIVVAPGTYYEHLVWPQVSNIKLFSSGNKGNTIIDGSKNGRVLTIDMTNENTINQKTQIKGFTITRGLLSLTIENTLGEGAGVLLNNASPKFSNCSFIKNYITGALEDSYDATLYGFGAGVCCKNSTAAFAKCLFKGNYSKSINEMYGSALYTVNSIVSLTDCEVTGNKTNTFFNTYQDGKAAGVIHADNSTLTIQRCQVTENEINDANETYPAGAVSIIGGSAEIINTLFRDNTHGGASEINPGGSAIYGANADLEIVNVTSNQNGNVLGTYGTSLYLDNFASNTITVQNSIFWNNGSSSEIYTDNSGVLSVTYSDLKYFFGYPGTGNINLNPEFISVEGDNLLLQPNSPCAGTGSLTDAPEKDLQGTNRPLPAGTNPDMGCYEINQPLKVNSGTDVFAHFAIYPNPSQGDFTLDLQTDSAPDCTATIQVSNTIGQIVYTQNEMIHNNQLHLNISIPVGSTEGVYLISVEIPGQVFREKIVYKH